MNGVENSIKFPDIWQQEATKHLIAGRDVVVHAPTGAGKTYIFELLVQAGLKRQAIYTVPTRALANDKRNEWQGRGWNVGIATGDIAENLDAPIIVATLETQKSKLLKGQGPGILVIDEYQMLADASRGTHYELAIALAPPGTQILMLSGSVANPHKVVNWLKRIGRDAVMVYKQERPVPQEEIHMDALPQRIPTRIRGFWPRLITRALLADLGPILVFAPRRKVAEDLARQLSAAIPIPDWLELTPEQKAIAGDPLGKMLRNRIAFHHSGLSYPQRAGLVEPLAKAGQLRVVVATTGLGAGINFSMRSVIVTDREYQMGSQSQFVRADELLQMFGRAGRRGMDKRGYILVAPGKPRLSEAHPISIKRSHQIDWTSFLAFMHNAVVNGEHPVEAAEGLSERLFTESPMRLGLKRFTPPKPNKNPIQHLPHKAQKRPKLTEMMNGAGDWERQTAPRKVKLGEALLYHNTKWKPALRDPQILQGLDVGNLCKIKKDGRRLYGRQVALATFPVQRNAREVVLTKWLQRALRNYYKTADTDQRTPGKHWDLDLFEKKILPLLPYLTQGGQAHEIVEQNNLISARLDYSEATVFARIDKQGNALINPPYREVDPSLFPTFAELTRSEHTSAPKLTAETWYALGLIDNHKHPTRRGVIFSFFNHGEGLAIAAALEDPTYDLTQLIFDLANLRAGHRFEEHENTSSRLADICRITYRGMTCRGYLEHGIPVAYGNGAAEVLAAIKASPHAKSQFLSETLHAGDIERAELEWKSILNHICFAPDFEWERWMELKDRVRTYIASHYATSRHQPLPTLLPAQRQRYKGRLRLA